MKYNVQKLQGGGFLTFTPIAKQPIAPPQTTDTAQKSDDSGSSIISKGMYEKLVNDGLVNDVNYFVTKLEQISSRPRGFADRQNSSDSFELLKDLNRIQQNKQLWDKTYQDAKESGGLGEVAVGNGGELFVKGSDGKLKGISMAEYSKHRDKYSPLTVSEILRARQYDPNLVYNDSLFQVGETSVGINKIISKVKDAMDLIQEDHTKSERHYAKPDLEKQLAYLKLNKTPNDQEKTAIANLQQELLTPGEQYKVVNENKSKSRYANVAFNYILSALSKPERLKLEATATINGTNVKDFLEKSLTLGLSGEENISEISPEKKGAGEADESMKNMTNLSNDELFFQGKLNTGQEFLWNDPATGKKIAMPTTGQIVWHDKGEPIGMATINQAAQTSMSQYLQTNDVTFGGKPLSLGDRDKIVQEGDFNRIYLPVNPDGTPNLNMLEQLKEAQSEVAKHPDWNPQQINEFYQERGLGELQVDDKGNIQSSSNLKPFMVGWGYTTDEADATANNPFIEEIPSGMEKQVDTALTKVYKAAGVSKPTSMFGTWGTDYYKGIIAYPIRETASINAAANKGNVFYPKIGYDTSKVLLNAQSFGRKIPQGSAQIFNTSQ